jgi:hypothetical protein
MLTVSGLLLFQTSLSTCLECFASFACKRCEDKLVRGNLQSKVCKRERRLAWDVLQALLAKVRFVASFALLVSQLF